MSTTIIAASTATASNVLHLFPEIDTELADSAEIRDGELAGYDEEQVRLMEEVCIVLDTDDRPIGSASKKTCRFSTFPITTSYKTETTSSPDLPIS